MLPKKQPAWPPATSFLLAGRLSASCLEPLLLPSARSRARAEREFSSRVLNNMELAPGGRATGSAFLPNVPGARSVVVQYNQGGTISLLEVPLPYK